MRKLFLLFILLSSLALCSCAIIDHTKEWPGKPAAELEQTLGDECWDCTNADGSRFLSYTRMGQVAEESWCTESVYNSQTKKWENKTVRCTVYRTYPCTLYLHLDSQGKVASFNFSSTKSEACYSAFPERSTTIYPWSPEWNSNK